MSAANSANLLQYLRYKTRLTREIVVESRKYTSQVEPIILIVLKVKRS